VDCSTCACAPAIRTPPVSSLQCSRYVSGVV